MNNQEFKRHLKHITKNEHINKHNWKHGLTAFWINYFATNAIKLYHIKPALAREISIKYFKNNPKLSHDPAFNHGGLIDGNIKLMLYKNYLINKKQLQTL